MTLGLPAVLSGAARPRCCSGSPRRRAGTSSPGYSGYFSFGQAAYVGIGAYATAVLYGRHGVSFYLTVLVGAALCAAAGAGDRRARVPAALAARRDLRAAHPGRAVHPRRAGPHQPDHRRRPGHRSSRCRRFPAGSDCFQDCLYLLDAGSWPVAAVAVALAMQHSRFGWALAAIRDAEDVAEGLGVATFRYKMLAICSPAPSSAASAAALFALQIGFVAVDSVFRLTVPLFVIVMSVLGGRTHWLGPVDRRVLVVTAAGPADRLRPGPSGNSIVLGAVLVVLVVVAPDGLYGRMRARPLAPRWARSSSRSSPATASRAARACSTDPRRHARWPRLVAVVAARAGPPATDRPGRRGPTPAARGRTGRPAPEPGAGRRRPSSSAEHGGPLLRRRARARGRLAHRPRRRDSSAWSGPNGSGKTTLVNLLSGTLRPTRGTIRDRRPGPRPAGAAPGRARRRRAHVPDPAAVRRR